MYNYILFILCLNSFTLYHYKRFDWAVIWANYHANCGLDSCFASEADLRLCYCCSMAVNCSIWIVSRKALLDMFDLVDCRMVALNYYTNYWHMVATVAVVAGNLAHLLVANLMAFHFVRFPSLARAQSSHLDHLESNLFVAHSRNQSNWLVAFGFVYGNPWLCAHVVCDMAVLTIRQARNRASFVSPYRYLYPLLTTVFLSASLNLDQMNRGVNHPNLES